MEDSPGRSYAQMAKLANHVRHARNSRFVRNVVTVASGTAGIQIMGAIFAPILTRQYGPVAYGALGAFMALSGVLTNIAGLTYPIAMVLPAEDQKARQLGALSVALAVFLAGVLTVVLWLSGGQIARDLGMAEVSGVLALLPIAVVLITCLSVSRQWLIRKGRFSVIATFGVAHSLIANSFKAIVGVIAPSATALVAIGALAPGLYVLMLGRSLRDLASGSSKDEPGRRISFQGMHQAATEYRDFPLYRAPQHLLNSFSLAVPMLMLASAFGAPAAGYYAITQTVMGLPSMLIGKSVGDVFYPRVTESIRLGRRADREITKATLALLAAGALPFGLIVLVGPALFEFVFGQGWSQAGHYARWLVPFFLLNLVNKPAVVAIAPLGLQGKLLVYEILATAAKVGAFLLGFLIFREAIAAVALFSIAGASAYAILIVYMIRTAGKVR